MSGSNRRHARGGFEPHMLPDIGIPIQRSVHVVLTARSVARPALKDASTSSVIITAATPCVFLGELRLSHPLPASRAAVRHGELRGGYISWLSKNLIMLHSRCPWGDVRIKTERPEQEPRESCDSTKISNRRRCSDRCSSKGADRSAARVQQPERKGNNQFVAPGSAQHQGRRPGTGNSEIFAAPAACSTCSPP